MKDDERRLLLAAAAADVRWRELRQHRFIDALAEGLGIHPKRGLYLAGKWSDKGWWEYGVTLRSGWLTAAGKAKAAELGEQDRKAGP